MNWPRVPQYPWPGEGNPLPHRTTERLVAKTRKPLRTGPGLKIQETAGGTLISLKPTATGELRCRWFRVLTDSQAISLPDTNDTDNDLKCRTHFCEGNNLPDDAPSVWGIWEESENCTWYPVPQDEPATLVYFPMYRSLCSGQAPEDPADRCRGGTGDPDCRKDKHIFACWNETAQRWEAVADVPECAMAFDVTHVVVCESDTMCYTNPIAGCCCLYDGLKVDFKPAEGAIEGDWCPPDKERTKVWLLCANGFQNISRGYCTLGTKVCDAWVCKRQVGSEIVEEERPVYMMECGPCVICQCPNQDPQEGPAWVKYRLLVNDPNGPCGYFHNLDGQMQCLDLEPFVDPGALNPPQGYGQPGWYADFRIYGVTPRLLYHATPWNQETYPAGVWLEIDCGGEGIPGSIIAAWDLDEDNNWVEVAIPANTGHAPGGAANQIYESGIDDCDILTNDLDQQLYRPRTYEYGLWTQCDENNPQSALFFARLYLLKHDYSRVAKDPCFGTEAVLVADHNALMSDAKNAIQFFECCDNVQKFCWSGLTFGCTADQVPITDLAGLTEGTTVCSPCNHPRGGHVFGGCPCDWIVNGTDVPCEVGPQQCNQQEDPWPNASTQACCDHLSNWFCIEFEWPEWQYEA